MSIPTNAPCGYSLDAIADLTLRRLSDLLHETGSGQVRATPDVLQGQRAGVPEAGGCLRGRRTGRGSSPIGCRAVGEDTRASPAHPRTARSPSLVPP